MLAQLFAKLTASREAAAPAQQNAEVQAAYNAQIKALAANIAALQAVVVEHQRDQQAEPWQWGYVGDLEEANHKLRQMAAWLSGDENWDRL